LLLAASRPGCALCATMVFDDFLRGLPRFTFTFGSAPEALANESAYWQSLGMIFAWGAVAALLCALARMFSCLCWRCNHGKGSAGGTKSGVAEPLTGPASDGEDGQPAGCCSRCCYRASVLCMLLGTLAGVVLAIVGSTEVSRTIGTVGDELGRAGSLLSSTSEVVNQLTADGASLATACSDLEALCAGACGAPVESALSDAAQAFGDGGQAATGLAEIATLLDPLVMYSNDTPDTAATADDIRVVCVFVFCAVILAACTGAALRGFCPAKDSDRGGVACAKGCFACVFVPLAWTTVISCWLVSSSHLTLATLLSDFCAGNCDTVADPGCTPTPTGAALGLLPESQAQNLATFEYFLECADGVDNPFGQYIADARASTAGCVADPAPCDAIVTAGNTLGTPEAIALASQIAGADTGLIYKVEDALDDIDQKVNCAEPDPGGGIIPSVWTNTITAVCEAGDGVSQNGCLIEPPCPPCTSHGASMR
jgi:hypothetical protein